jgi:hypothetical protein
VDSSTVSANQAELGGGIYNKALLYIQNNSMIGETQAGNKTYGSDGEGGGVYNNSGGTATIDHSRIRDNSADSGGGIFNKGTLYIQNGSTLSGNTCDNRGGGIYNLGTTTVDNSTFISNKADIGGGIFNEGKMNIQNGSIIGKSGAGNQATTAGGGIYNYDDNLVIEHCTISANTSVEGGGIYNVAYLRLDDTTVSDNSADYGGGIFNSVILLVQNGSKIGVAGAGNEATFNGGGIYSSGIVADVVLDNITISDNRAQNGAGIYTMGALTVQNGSNIGLVGAGNLANEAGGGIYNAYGTTTVKNSCIIDNSAYGTGGGVYSDEDTAGATEITGSWIVGNSAYSFENNQPSKQIATGNWWGATTGPNTPGADTVNGNVDTSDYLTEPSTICFHKVNLPLLLK